MWTPFAIAFTIVTVAASPTRNQHIDGYNGLASGYA